MKYMLDTNIGIYAIKNKPERVLQRLQENQQDGLCISAITLSELEYGAAKKLQSAEESGCCHADAPGSGCPAFC